MPQDPAQSQLHRCNLVLHDIARHQTAQCTLRHIAEPKQHATFASTIVTVKLVLCLCGSNA